MFRLSHPLLVAGIAALSLAALAPAANAQLTAFAIANGGSTLISFSPNNPGVVTEVGGFTLNGTPTFLDAIDFRPLTGGLYGYLDSTDTLYQVNYNTGALSVVASGSGASATNTNLLGIDFNPTIDRVRIVTDSTQNLVYNPNNSNPPTVATSLFYGAGDVNELSNALIIDNAYNNNRVGGGASQQYVIDYGLNTLATLANNTGVLATVAELTLAGVGTVIDTDIYTGFDIYSPGAGLNTAYAVLDSNGGNTPTFYTLDLVTGAATPVGAIGGGYSQVYSLAVATVPEPGTVGLMLGAGAMFGAGLLARRKKA